jgi:hypothetical protein
LAAIAEVAGTDDVRACVRRVRGHGVTLAFAHRGAHASVQVYSGNPVRPVGAPRLMHHGFRPRPQNW